MAHRIHCFFSFFLLGWFESLFSNFAWRNCEIALSQMRKHKERLLGVNALCADKIWRKNSRKDAMMKMLIRF